MLDWIRKNKDWLFSGIGVKVGCTILTALMGLGGWLWFQGGNSPPRPNDNSVHQTHNGTGDNVVRDKNVTTDNSIHQMLIGSGDNVTGNKLVQIYGKSQDYQKLTNQLVEQEKDQKKLVQRIRKYPGDEEFVQDLIDCNKKIADTRQKIADTRQKIDDFKAEVYRLHELFTRIPINTERRRRAKEHFDKGEFREADAVLKAEEIQQDVEQRKARRAVAMDTVAAMDRDLAYLADDYLLKARLSLLSPVPEDGTRFERAKGWFEQALATARTAELLGEYAVFLWKHNAFGRAEPLCQEALKHYRSLAESNPEAFLPDVAGTLNNLALLHKATQAFGPALAEYEEALKIRRGLAESNPEAFLPDVAGTLNNLGELHRITNKYGLALKKFQEALKVYRNLSEAESGEFLPDLAMILNNLGLLHSETGDFDSARKEFKEALKLFRGLAKAKPEVFLRRVADSLNNFGILHKEIGAFGPALQEYEEALKLYRGLAEREPEEFLPYVAGTLNNLGELHRATNEYGPARQEYEEALKIKRSLVEREPGAFTQDLSETLLNLSIFYLESMPDKAKSVAYAQEARDILKPLIQRAPHLQGHLDHAEQLLADNKAKPIE